MHLFFSLKDQKINLPIWAEIVFFNRKFLSCVLLLAGLIFSMLAHQEAWTSSVQLNYKLRLNAEARLQMRWDLYYILNHSCFLKKMVMAAESKSFDMLLNDHKAYCWWYLVSKLSDNANLFGNFSIIRMFPIFMCF